MLTKQERIMYVIIAWLGVIYFILCGCEVKTGYFGFKINGVVPQLEYNVIRGRNN